jgi:hypothetical protein
MIVGSQSISTSMNGTELISAPCETRSSIRPNVYVRERVATLNSLLRARLSANEQFDVKRPMSDPLAEYVIALTFSSRASSPYEVHGEAMASNMAHGITPEVVSRFRRAILEGEKYRTSQLNCINGRTRFMSVCFRATA